MAVILVLRPLAPFLWDRLTVGAAMDMNAGAGDDAAALLLLLEFEPEPLPLAALRVERERDKVAVAVGAGGSKVAPTGVPGLEGLSLPARECAAKMGTEAAVVVTNGWRSSNPTVSAGSVSSRLSMLALASGAIICSGNSVSATSFALKV